MTTPTIENLVAALQYEWKTTIYRYARELYNTLQMPNFQIYDMAEWGRWEGGTVQCLSLSWALVLGHPWYAVVDVLRHEMAHELTEYFYGPGVEAPHGPLFQKTCRMLRANPAASSTFPLLDRLVFHPEEEESAHVAKIRKLLSLATSSNVNEAEAALLKAQELMAKYHVELPQIDKEENFVAITCGAPLARVSREWTSLSWLLERHYDVFCVWIGIPNMDAKEDGAMQRRSILEICGRRDRVVVATYVYDYILRYIDNCIKSDPKLRKIGVRARRDFMLGVIYGFEGTLQSRQAASITALIQQDAAQLKEFVHFRYPHMKHFGSSQLQIDQSLYAAGEKAGRNMVIPRGVENEDLHDESRRLNKGQSR
jgi:hypothetical protein